MPYAEATLGFLLHDAARFLRKRFEQNARSLGLTRAQWQVLAHLTRNEGIHQSGLAEILDMDGITLVRMLDKLEARGLVERRQHPTDRRVWLLFLRPAATSVLAEMQLISQVTRGEALAGISPQDQETLIRTLTEMKTNLIRACSQPPAATVPETATHG